MEEACDKHPESTENGDLSEIERIFTEIFRTGSWGSLESVSGPGSTRERASQFLNELLDSLRRLGVRSLLDAPCGDFNWAAPIADEVEEYIGVDVVSDLILRKQKLHGNERRNFRHCDIIREPLLTADVILCRDCLVHFSLADIFRTVANFRRSGATYLIATTFISMRPNEDIETGGWRPINLRLSPFLFPRPVFEIDEHCLHSAGHCADKRLGVWRLADFRSRF